MAFFRFNRDKRGYEHFYLVEPVTNRRGKSRPRVLYWYRTPPNIKIGRPPFDADVQRALEAQNPNVVFDWRKIIDAPIPSADAEKWRERRREERAEKAARRATPATPAAGDAAAPPANTATAVDDTEAADRRDISDAEDDGIDAAIETAEAALSSDTGLATSADAPAGATADPSAIRRRRRRRRHRGRRPDSPATVSATETATATSSETVPASNPVEPAGD